MRIFGQRSKMCKQVRKFDYRIENENDFFTLINQIADRVFICNACAFYIRQTKNQSMNEEKKLENLRKKKSFFFIQNENSNKIRLLSKPFACELLINK